MIINLYINVGDENDLNWLYRVLRNNGYEYYDATKFDPYCNKEHPTLDSIRTDLEYK